MEYNEIAKVLRDTREILKDEKNWTKNNYYTDINGDCDFDLDFQDAECFCISGALCKSLGYDTVHHEQYDFDSGNEKLKEVARFLYSLSDSIYYLPHFNDRESTTHGDIIDLLDKGIRKAEKLV